MQFRVSHRKISPISIKIFFRVSSTVKNFEKITVAGGIQ
jgi:hypothetical protein